MRRPRLGRLAVVLAPLSLTLALLPATVQAEPAATATTAATTVSAADPPVELPHAARGAAALELLGDQVDDAAALNDLRPGQLTELLRTDRSAWLSEEGRVYYREPLPAEPAPAGATPAAAYPLDDTLALHSRPGSDHTIFLDFDGARVDGTAWNDQHPRLATTHPAWDPSGDGPAFSDDERGRIQAVWTSVAEDFAPFDVDVTTEDPGPGAIHRSAGDDPTYGSHVLISPSSAWATLCGRTCGGFAYLGVTDEVSVATPTGYGYYAPAWVFSEGLHDIPKNIAEAASHEAGHNLGLDHDGATATPDYYLGHGHWAPIMGAGYYEPVTQWSAGTYSGANNQQDDVDILARVLGRRPDEATGTLAQAPGPPTGTVYVTSRQDVDVYSLGECAGPLVLEGVVAEAANLDLRVRVLDATGLKVAVADPPSVSTTTAVGGLGATVTTSLTPGTYYAAVDGVGSGAWATRGYDDYGSLGAYTLRVAQGCREVTPTSTTLTAAVNGSTVTLDAVVSAADGPAPAGTVEFLESDRSIDTATLSEGRATATLTGVAVGAHDYRAVFVPAGAEHAGSQSAPASARVEPAASTTRLSAPTRARTGSRPTVTVAVSSGGEAATGAVTVRAGTTTQRLRLQQGRATLRLPALRAGRLSVTARYRGTATTLGSSARRVIRVR